MSREEQEKNLLVVTAVEEYSRNHHLPARETLSLFIRHRIPQALRAQYDVLHMLDLSESTQFAEAMLRRTAESLPG